MVKNTSPLVVAVTGATTSAVNGYLPYRISVLHLLPRYAPRTENPPGRCQHCDEV